MSKRWLFVGERPSRKADTMKVSWKDGRLCAKQLFDALAYCEISLKHCQFINLFVANHAIQPTLCRRASRQIAAKYKVGFIVVAMGRKVAAYLEGQGLPHLQIVHPAARGLIRKKERYCRHVHSILCPAALHV